MGVAKSKEKNEGIGGINTLTLQWWHFMVQHFYGSDCFLGNMSEKNIQQQLGPQIYVCLEIPCQGGR